MCHAAELRQGQLIDTHVDRVNNADGTVTETTVYTVKEVCCCCCCCFVVCFVAIDSNATLFVFNQGNVTKKITEVKTFTP
jgi:hypothetical protein